MSTTITKSDPRLAQYSDVEKEALLAYHEMISDHRDDWTLEQSITSFFDYIEKEKKHR